MPDWLSPKLLYQVPLWALTRPQQMVFQGAKRGSETYENAAARYQNQGDDPLTANLKGLALSGVAGLQGMTNAMNPWAEDVSGSELTQDFTENPYIDKGLGFALDLAADPLNAPIGAAGKVAGTALRTGRNLQKIRKASRAEQPVGKLIPEGYATAEAHQATKASPTVARTSRSLWETKRGEGHEAALELLNRLGMKKYLLDIPVAPRGNEPLSIRGAKRDVSDIAEALLDKPKTPGYELYGRYSPRSNMLLYNRVTQSDTLPHEMVHWSRATTPDPFRGPTREALMKILAKNPRAEEILRAMPSYQDIPPQFLAEEMVARKHEQALTHSNPLIRRLAERAYDAIQPEMYQDATRIPLEALYSGMKLGERY